jgi:hypothetical protein
MSGAAVPQRARLATVLEIDEEVKVMVVLQAVFRKRRSRIHRPEFRRCDSEFGLEDRNRLRPGCR